MSRTELEAAVASARRSKNSSNLLARFHEKRIAAVGFLLALRPSNALAGDMHLRSLKSLLRTPGPLRAAILSLAALAAGVLGLIVAYGVVPNESAASEQLNASTVRLVTVSGPEGTTTLAITKTKEGKTKIVPVRVLRTVTGPGGVRTLSIEVAGPAVTQIRDGDGGRAPNRHRGRDRHGRGRGHRDGTGAGPLAAAGGPPPGNRSPTAR
jgi:hypothetical protein